MSLTDEQKRFYSEAVRNSEHKTKSQLCRDLNLNRRELAAVFKELGLAKPPLRGKNHIVHVPKETIEEFIRRGMFREEISLTLGISHRAILRLARIYHLTIPSPVDKMRQLAAQGLRRCCDCKETKNQQTDFSNNKTDRYGKNKRCRKCLSLSSSKSRQTKPKSSTNLPEAAVSASESRIRKCRRCHRVKLLETEFDPHDKGHRSRSAFCRDCRELQQQEAAERQAFVDLDKQGLRRCRRCQEIRGLEQDFGIDRRDPTGRTRLCVSCLSYCRRSYEEAQLARAAGETGDKLSSGLTSEHAASPQPEAWPNDFNSLLAS